MPTPRPHVRDLRADCAHEDAKYVISTVLATIALVLLTRMFVLTDLQPNDSLEHALVHATFWIFVLFIFALLIGAAVESERNDARALSLATAHARDVAARARARTAAAEHTERAAVERARVTSRDTPDAARTGGAL